MSTGQQKTVGRRLECRLEACVSIKVRILGCDIAGVTHDLSAGGIRMSIVSPRRFQVGEHYPLEVELPGEPTPVKTQARVARVVEPAGAFGKANVAFEFCDMEEDDQARIARFIYRRQIQNRGMGNSGTGNG